MPNTQNLLQTLLENEIEFVLVGGLAATLYGASTVTYDVDVCFDFAPENLQKLMDALKAVHPRVRGQEGWVALEELPLPQLASLKNLYLQTDNGGLDLLGSLTKIGDYPQVKARSQEIALFGKPCHILTLEALIEVKEGLGRPKDQQVVLELKVISEKQN